MDNLNKNKMANTLKQTVSQYDLEGIEKRMIVQYSENGGQEILAQKIKNYSDLTAEQKTVFDNYEALCQTIMNE